jgi:eukaryotic-like serine/threonine-protein kinase
MTASQRLRAGRLLGGRYRLLEPLPGGGRSWAARDEVDGRELIARLIVLPDTMPAAERDAARQHALHDAATLSRVRHPAVAYVVDTVVEDGVPWVVSLRPPGRGLGALVRTDGPISAERAARIGLQALDALDAARVPHGDLTPDDVLVTEDDRIAIVGFGTTPVDGTETPGFRAPEGGPAAAADLWALGVTLYAAVEGRLPDGPGGGALRPVLDRLLAFEPARRSGGNDVRVLLVRVGGAPPVGSPRLNDPDVAAALAAFDAALPGPPQVPEPATDEPALAEPAAIEVVPPAPRTSTEGEPAAPPQGPAPPRQEPPETAPGRPARADTRRRWSWAAVAAVAVLVVLAVALPAMLRREGGTPPAAAPSQTVGPATPSPQDAIPPPPGFRLYRDPAGWSIGVPTDWTTGRAGPAVTFHDGARVLSVVARDDAPRDPYREQLAQAPDLAKDTAGYDFRRIARVSYRGWPTSDWEYLSRGRSVLHTLARTTVPIGGTAYEITWTTSDRNWTADKRFFDTAVATFDPGA